MALIQMVEGFRPRNDERLLRKADIYKPVLHYDTVQPVRAFYLRERYSSEQEEVPLEELPNNALKRGHNLVLDFGRHMTGRLKLRVSATGSHPDAPAHLKLKFAETAGELGEDSSGYDGWVSSGWIQEEYVHVDELPAQIELPRRYAFRYLKVTVLATSPKYRLVVNSASCVTETSADLSTLTRVSYGDELLDRICEVSLNTLSECMQDVFEDGPKRDRRLWMGDLRLQALVNYASFRNMGLVKRCLYLFAGSTFPDGRVSANVFTTPYVDADDTWLFDYSLFFVNALEEYLEQTGDGEALADLFHTARQQLALAASFVGEDGLIEADIADDAFIDWTEGLHRRCAAQGVMIDSLGYGVRLARRMGDAELAGRLEALRARMTDAARREFWDEGQRLFVCDGEASCASQVWMVIAGVTEGDEARDVMARAEHVNPERKMLTPYMHHYYVEALLACGMRDEALEHIRSYWGSMVEAGADTFYEAWDPEDPDASPYGGRVINSYCHAWSCTPALLLQRIFSSDHETEND